MGERTREYSQVAGGKVKDSMHLSSLYCKPNIVSILHRVDDDSARALCIDQTYEAIIEENYISKVHELSNAIFIRL